MTAPSGGQDRAARAVALFIFLGLVEAFFMLYTDMFRRRMDLWIEIVLDTAVVLTFAILIYWLGGPCPGGRWVMVARRARGGGEEGPRGRSVWGSSHEGASA